MKKSLGFTLAEVLITLAIIGVVAAMTVPSVIQNTNQQEYRTATKKAVTTLNQALTMNIAVNQVSPAAIAAGAEYETLAAYFEDVLNAVEVSDDGVITTQDGIQYDFGDATACTAAAPCTIYVDLNGRKNPSSASTPEASYTAGTVAVTGSTDGTTAPTLVAALDENGRFPADSILDSVSDVTFGEIVPLLITDTAVFPGSNVAYAAMYQK